MSEVKKYYLGLDMGTNSVGWAVVDPETNDLVKKNGKTLWGARLFNEGNSAKDRRSHRCSRRGIRRRVERREWLKELIGPELIKETGDKTFFERLENSFYYNEDKDSNIVTNSNKNKNKNDYIVFDGSLVDGKPYTDYDFRKEYKTIYHLRKEMMDNKDKKFDLRMIYLVLNHMNSHRGHFLFEGDLDISSSSQKELKVFFEQLNSSLRDYAEDEEFENNEEYFGTISKFEENEEEFFNELERIMVRDSSKTTKKAELLSLFGVEKKTFVNEVIIPLFAGSDVNVASISLYKEDKLEKTQINYTSENVEEGFDNAADLIPAFGELFGAALKGKVVYDYYLLKNILNGKKRLTDAMVDRYDEHNRQLNELKDIIKLIPDEIVEIDGIKVNKRVLFYNIIFRYDASNTKQIAIFNELFKNQKSKVDAKKLNNYRAYIGYNKEHGKTTRTKHLGGDAEDFYAFMKDVVLLELEALLTSESLSAENKEKLTKFIECTKASIETKTYLLRHNAKSNSAFPNQLVTYEARTILDNQSKFYPFLDKKDKYGTVADKLVQILKFKLPYYVGPIKTDSNLHDQNAWCIKNPGADQKLYPWTLDEIVDKSATAREFIQRMQNKCQYLKTEYCLPKSSIIFSEYKCLQYLNKVYVNGSPIEHDVKMDILNKFFKQEGADENKYSSKTKKTLKEFIKDNYGDKTEVTTSNSKELEEINCEMKSYYFFKQLLGDDFESHQKDVEQIICDCTIFEDKKILEERLRTYDFLNEEQIKKIKGLNYAGYGRLSGKLLNEIEFENKQTGEVNTVLGFMREGNVILQELLSSDYTLSECIDEYNRENLDTNDGIEWLDYIDENIYVNPAMKTTLIQAYRIIEEVRRIVYPAVIDKFYIESTRAEDKNKKRTSSRYEKLKEMYIEAEKLVKAESKYEFFGSNISDAKKELEIHKNDLQSDMYFLYFSQLGRDMYEPEKSINIEDVRKNTYLDIDHIYPQAILKDDSLANRVLTNKKFNSEVKGDKFLCEIDSFRKNLRQNEAFYELLLKSKLISKEKYRRLTQKETDLDKVIANFENRQLVTTNQAIIGLRDLLVLFDEVPATSVIFTKGNNISDFRHQYDLPKSRIANNFHHAHDAYLNVVVGRPIHDYFNYYGIIRSKSDYDRLFKGKGITANPIKILSKDQEQFNWKKDEMIKKINYNLYSRYDVLETSKAYVNKNLLKQVTVLPAGGGTAPVQTSSPKANIERYGGFTSPSYQNFVLFEGTDKKGKTATHIIAVSQFDKVDLINSIKKTYPKYVSIKILIEELKVDTVVKRGPHKFYLSGRHRPKGFVVRNARDIYWNKESVKILKKIEKYISVKSSKKNINESVEKAVIAVARNENCEAVELSRDELNIIYRNMLDKLEKPTFKYLINKSKEDLPYVLDVKTFPSIEECVKQVVSILECLHTNEQKSNNKVIDKSGKSIGINVGDFENGSGLVKSGYDHDGINKPIEIVAESITGYYTKVLYKADNK